MRDWVWTAKGVLFLPYQADQMAALRSIISAWLRLAIFQTMTGGEGDQRLWFMVDELDALGPIDGPMDALARHSNSQVLRHGERRPFVWRLHYRWRAD